ncbi:MAG: hypothetical protein AAB967_04430, partial [Patescibacteria group bacterium]
TPMKQNVLIGFLAVLLLGILSLSAIDVPREENTASSSLAPDEKTALTLAWGDIPSKLVQAGVIDRAAFEAVYENRGGIPAEEKALLLGTMREMRITEKNAGVALNLLWAFGLANKNRILEEGPMADPRYGGAGGFASTGGWTLARGEAMSHYSAHPFLTLTEAEQVLVERVSKNIYRPCCDNATYFPDCNHGMAMLGFLTLLAKEGKSEAEMYKAALALNRLWFPDTYAAIDKYLEMKSAKPNETNPKELLGYEFSSASGYRRILAAIEPIPSQGGGSCGV